MPAIVLALLLAGCATRAPLVTINEAPAAAEPSVYTRAEVDAINATAQCKLLARTVLQIARCETRR